MGQCNERVRAVKGNVNVFRSTLNSHEFSVSLKRPDVAQGIAVFAAHIDRMRNWKDQKETLRSKPAHGQFAFRFGDK